jgi:hypothetical protein
MNFINNNIETVHERTLLALDPATGTAAFFSGKSAVSFFEVSNTGESGITECSSQVVSRLSGKRRLEVIGCHPCRQ